MNPAIYVAPRDLPDTLQRALNIANYRRSDVAIEAREQVSVADMGGQGRRAFVILVDLATGRNERIDGSWGGANAFSPGNAVDRDTTPHNIVPGMAVIRGSEGGDRPVTATIYLHPANVAALLPPKPEITERERAILRVLGGYTSAGRKAEFAQMRVTGAELDAIVGKGWASRNKAGAMAITLAGKNAR